MNAIWRWTALISLVGLSVISMSAMAGKMTADEIVARYLEARGGAKRWRQLEALETQGTYSAFSKRSDFTQIRQRGDLFRLDFVLLDSPAIRARGSAGPWMLHGLLSPEAALVEEDPYKSQLERESLFPLVLLDAGKKGHQIRLLDPGDVDGIPAVVLEVTLTSGQVETWYLDAETFLEVAVDTQIYDYTQFMEPVSMRTFYDDFREVEGLMLPFQVDMEFGARLESMTVEEAEVNPSVDEALFKAPPPSKPEN